MPSLRPTPDSSVFDRRPRSEGPGVDSPGEGSPGEGLTVAPTSASGTAEPLAGLDDLLSTPSTQAPSPFGLEAGASPKALPSPQGQAFTLAELGLVGLIAVLVGAIVLTGLSEWRAWDRAERCAGEFRTLAAAFERYRRDTGAWPAAAREPGVLPAGMETLLPQEKWWQPSPFGGHYAWVAKNAPALAITAFVPDAPLELSRRDLQRIDRLLDDGHLDTGRFRAGYNGWPLYLLNREN